MTHLLAGGIGPGEVVEVASSPTPQVIAATPTASLSTPATELVIKASGMSWIWWAIIVAAVLVVGYVVYQYFATRPVKK